LCPSTSLYRSIGSYCLSLLFQSDPWSTCTSCKLALILSSRLCCSVDSGSPSSRGRRERLSVPAITLPGLSFTSKSNCRMHAMQEVTCPPCRSLEVKFRCCSNVVASVSMRNQTPYA
jgi:hypothetical protein